jgi:hypothetical protein
VSEWVERGEALLRVRPKEGDRRLEVMAWLEGVEGIEREWWRDEGEVALGMGGGPAWAIEGSSGFGGVEAIAVTAMESKVPCLGEVGLGIKKRAEQDEMPPGLLAS